MKRREWFYGGSLSFGEASQFAEFFVELTTMSILQDQENALSVVKPTVKPQNVRVPEPCLDLHFPAQLVVQSVLLYLLLEHHLQRHYILTL